MADIMAVVIGNGTPCSMLKGEAIPWRGRPYVPSKCP